MPYYNLKTELRVLSTPARDCEEALRIFGEEIGEKLTLEKQDCVAPHLLGERVKSLGWVSATIPVWQAPSP